jgi:DeoR family deoxyribose operon repressor
MAFFDCGTTTPWIIDAIDDALPFTGVCYSLNTFLALQEKPQCRAILCGGSFMPATRFLCR